MAEWLGGLLQGLGSVASGLFGYFGQKNTNASQERINQANLDLQRDAWAREDNSIQRRVADLKAAGLSPTLAAGQGATSSGPTISLKAQDSGLANFGGIGQGLANAIAHSREQDLLKAQIDAQKLDNKLQDEKSIFFRRQANLQNDILGYNAQVKMYEAQIADYLYEQVKWNFDHRKSKEAREWLNTFSRFIPDVKIGI